MKVFHFDCFAVLTDDWTLGTTAEPSEPENEPKIKGFFIDTAQASAFIATEEAKRTAKNDEENKRTDWRRNYPLRKRTYFIVPLQQISTKRANYIFLSDVEDALEQAAKLMGQGVTMGPNSQVQTLPADELPAE